MKIGPTLALILVMLVYSKRKGSLSSSGCFGAVLVGLATFLNPQLFSTLILLVFFITSSVLTKFKSAQKQTLEEGVFEAGQRDFAQVMCNGLTGSVLSLLYQLSVDSSSSSSSSSTYQDICLTGGGWPTFFMVCFIGHYACCCADTWASELGVLSPDWPYLITTLKQVPPGTNGAISLLGTLASLMGGQVIGLVAALTLRYQHPECGLRLGLMGLGMLAGLFGSFIDSLLGATIQATYFNQNSKKIIHGAPIKINEKTEENKIECISGSDCLDNNLVNFVSSFLTAMVTGVIGSWLLYAE